MEPSLEEDCFTSPRTLPVSHTGWTASGYCHSWLPRDCLLSGDCFASPDFLTFPIDMKLFPFSTLQPPSAVWGALTRKCLLFINLFLSISPIGEQKSTGDRGLRSISLSRLPTPGSGQLRSIHHCSARKTHVICQCLVGSSTQGLFRMC